MPYFKLVKWHLTLFPARRETALGNGRLGFGPIFGGKFGGKYFAALVVFFFPVSAVESTIFVLFCGVCGYVFGWFLRKKKVLCCLAYVGNADSLSAFLYLFSSSLACRKHISD
eukprot:g1659.t1